MLSIKITSGGSFTNEELKKLLGCIREIEQNDKERTIGVNVYTPDRTTKEMSELIDSINPNFRYKVIMERL